MPRLLPREGKFFDFFNQHAALASAAAAELQALLSDLSQMELRAKAIERNEKQADRITHDTVQLLHKTFITPLDRDDIQAIAGEIDDFVDDVEETGTRSTSSSPAWTTSSTSWRTSRPASTSTTSGR